MKYLKIFEEFGAFDDYINKTPEIYRPTKDNPFVKALKDMEEIEYLITDEGLRVRIDNVGDGKLRNVVWIKIDPTILAHDTAANKINLIWVKKGINDLSSFMRWLGNQDFYNEFLDRLREICYSNNLSLSNVGGYPSGWLEVRVQNSYFKQFI